MEHEYNANWMPNSAQKYKRAKRNNCIATIVICSKIFLVGMAAGYLVCLAQQAAQKAARIEAGYEIAR